MNEIKFWNDGWTPKGTVEVPAGYEELPAGSAFATRLAKKLCEERGKPVYIEMHYSKKGKYSHAIACWVPEGIIAEVRQAEQASEERRYAAREVAERRRVQRHEQDLKRLAARLGHLYPGLPESERMDVIERAFEVGSGRVGRTTKLDEDQKLRLAVIAHARHQHTEYDQLLADCWDREDAREMIGMDVAEIMEKWETPPRTRRTKKVSARPSAVAG